MSRCGVLKWVPSEAGTVPAASIVGGCERADPRTFVGRFRLRRGGRPLVGRVVPSQGCCFATSQAMEHRRRCYEVLVKAREEVTLVWKKEREGHVPDTAIAFLNDKKKKRAEDGDDPRDEEFYVGRVKIEKDVLVPGVVLSSHGVIHAGFDHSEVVKAGYEVLCRNEPCSLLYLAGRCVRERVRAREQWRNSRYSTKIANFFGNIERIFFTVIRKESRRRGPVPPERRLSLPPTLARYLTSPRDPRAGPVVQRLDFSTIMANCCPPEEECICQMWVEVTLSGLY